DARLPDSKRGRELGASGARFAAEERAGNRTARFFDNRHLCFCWNLCRYQKRQGLWLKRRRQVMAGGDRRPAACGLRASSRGGGPRKPTKETPRHGEKKLKEKEFARQRFTTSNEEPYASRQEVSCGNQLPYSKLSVLSCGRPNLHCDQQFACNRGRGTG